jgi:hypothetical protein
MSIRSFACQLAVRLALIGTLLAVGGVASYSATHWEPRLTGPSAPGADAAQAQAH